MWARLLNLSVCLLNQNKSLVSFCFLIRASDGSQITRPLVPCRVPRDAVVAGGRTEEKQDTRGAGALQALPWLSIKLQARYRRATAADLAQYKITGALRARYRRATRLTPPGGHTGVSTSTPVQIYERERDVINYYKVRN